MISIRLGKKFDERAGAGDGEVLMDQSVGDRFADGEDGIDRFVCGQLLDDFLGERAVWLWRTGSGLKTSGISLQNDVFPGAGPDGYCRCIERCGSLCAKAEGRVQASWRRGWPRGLL